MKLFLPVLAVVANVYYLMTCQLSKNSSVFYTEINMEHWWNDPLSRKPKYSEKICHATKSVTLPNLSRYQICHATKSVTLPNLSRYQILHHKFRMYWRKVKRGPSG